MSVVVYHNPKCGTSRNTIQMIRDAGIEPEIVEYLKAGWTEALLKDLFAAAGLTPREALRTRGSPAEELGLMDPSADDAKIIAAMVEHPILVERPFVQTPKGVRLCRPKEKVTEIL